jgi:hypothetical protein
MKKGESSVMLLEFLKLIFFLKSKYRAEITISSIYSISYDKSTMYFFTDLMANLNIIYAFKILVVGECYIGE